MKIRYAKKNEKEIAIKFWKDSFKDSEEQIKFYFDNIYNEKMCIRDSCCTIYSG